MQDNRDKNKTRKRQQQIIALRNGTIGPRFLKKSVRN